MGQYAELTGLVSAPHLNGRLAIITSQKQSNGRYIVVLTYPWKDPNTGVLKSHQLALKESNLKDIPRSSKPRSMPCNGCKQPFPRNDLKKCSECKFTRYCSKECQNNHWKAEHHGDCKVLRLQQLPEDAGDRVFARQERGTKLLMRNKPAEAEKEYRAIIEEDGCHMIGHYINLGQAINMQNRVDEALMWFRRATLLPSYSKQDDAFLVEAYMQIGHALQHLKKDVQGAKEAYDMVVFLNPQHTEANTILRTL